MLFGQFLVHSPNVEVAVAWNQNYFVVIHNTCWTVQYTSLVAIVSKSQSLYVFLPETPVTMYQHKHLPKKMDWHEFRDNIQASIHSFLNGKLTLNFISWAARNMYCKRENHIFFALLKHYLWLYYWVFLRLYPSNGEDSHNSNAFY